VLAGGFGARVPSTGRPPRGVHDWPVPDEFVEHGPQQALRSRYGIDAAGLTARVRRMLASEPGPRERGK
jgi:deoxyxylulose-5-phosphate synthase